MPPAVAAAGIAAGGAIAGGAIAGGAAKKAAKTQAAAAAQQTAAAQANQQYISSLEAPTIARGDAAGDVFAGLLGVGGDPAASAKALETFRGSNGYKDLLETGLKATNASAYARGMGNSGATLKALQDRATNIADRSQAGYLGNLGVLMNQGRSAVGNISGVATNTTNAINAATQTGADASSNAALLASQGWVQALQGVGNAGASLLGSSYGGQTGGINNVQQNLAPFSSSDPRYSPWVKY